VYDKQNILGPNPASEQAHVDYDKWTFFPVSTLGDMQGQVNWFSGHPTKNNDALTRYREQTLRTYGVLEGQLKATGGASILPQGFSAVDIHFLC
jgi:glutathione S-transferase